MIRPGVAIIVLILQAPTLLPAGLFRIEPGENRVEFVMRDNRGGFTGSTDRVEGTVTIRAEGDGVVAAIEGRIEDGLDIPAPSRAKRDERMVPTPITTALKAAVYTEMRKQAVSKSELARRMHVNEKEARRMLDPRHPTKVPTLERALAALGRRAEVAVS